MPALAFSKEFLQKIKALLEEEKVRLTSELEKFARKSGHVEGDYDSAFPQYGDKEDENAAEVTEYATNLPLEESLEKTLRDVVQSLDRLTKNTYGICKYCKKPIDEKRLLARPTSSACVECKKTIVQEM
ncbi:MAG: Transcriptional regulator, TraR/DksA family [Parcubacteria group bacterium GW2011_GWF2_38_8]|uniref:Transcriptional regulator, TraR/DksA family n=2 Tax=Candidatus Magasanikiibacteriota TaxID=1752731 RepID=A0A0G0H6Y0_9BACT|nr:MAG: Transcriptional regulator, TraR/DksA family [Candidatus Magasanikbacteria bacterium GW2011_GWC2_34_16]KKQ39028.1 MAG: Transcriptional regulator, TraR/DksA family [Candidatus Magasanikbacteria bacterium GW2011_GWA2_37_8]KKQ84980.1 MAG: Transcriptional regulator, TraR/DksA family [Parcubacteria group bacterium GW2011_GWF2_38_8]